MKSGKHQRSKQRCQNLSWKVHDRAQSFVLRLNTMHELRNQYVHLVSSTNGVNNYMYSVLCTVKAKKDSKSIQRRTLTSFIT